METFTPDSSAEEADFIKDLVFHRLPYRLRRIVINPSVEQFISLFAVICFTTIVGLGYLYGISQWG
jgi:hypothetical protein